MQIFIHPGFSRTATTTLQKQVFSKHSGLYNIGKPYTSQSKEWAAFVKSINFAEDMSFNENQILDYIKSDLVSNNIGDHPALLSHEGFTLEKHWDRSAIAERLKNLFPEAKIFFTVRDPIACIKSQYLYYYKAHIFKQPLPDFKSWLKVEVKAQKPHRLSNQCQYYELINCYASLFGRENVEVLVFEELLSDPASFAKKLADFMQIDNDETLKLIESIEKSNSSATKREYNFGRFNRFFVPESIRMLFARYLPAKLKSKFKDFLRNGESFKLELDEETDAYLKQIYHESNVKLEKEFRLGLEKYNYFMG